MMAKKLKEPGELKPTTVRIDEKILRIARAHGIDVSETMRQALTRAVLANIDQCPTCGKRR